ncbi:MAG: dephospho-CoA kinase [Flavobacteriaceae bacterium]|jgi:dephospho-CoA kinase|nr:dephospho-CoA kinase [Flavobacteriaceae bacterium]
MTKIVGLTGGIGSGKTTVAHMFKALGVPVFNSDDEAKVLMNSSVIIKQEIIELLGENSYKDDVLNKPYIASQIFNTKAVLKQINAIVHPKVAAAFDTWVSKQNSPYVIKEVAILFETRTESLVDFIITVIAPLETRIQRVMERDQKSREAVELIIDNQLSDSEKIKKSQYVIENNNRLITEKKVLEIHTKILDALHKS